MRFCYAAPILEQRASGTKAAEAKINKLRRQHFTNDECIHQVKSSSTQQVNLPLYYSSELQTCCVINVACENSRREESVLSVTVVNFTSPSGTTLTFQWGIDVLVVLLYMWPSFVRMEFNECLIPWGPKWGIQTDGYWQNFFLDITMSWLTKFCFALSTFWYYIYDKLSARVLDFVFALTLNPNPNPGLCISNSADLYVALKLHWSIFIYQQGI